MKKIVIVTLLFICSCTPWHKSKRISNKHNPNKIHKAKVKKTGWHIRKQQKSHDKVKKNN